MNSSIKAVEFSTGLESFSERYALVQTRLTELEEQGPIWSGNIKQYRMLLDELFQIGMERADYCYHWRENSESAPAN